jgi:hypothetical protein
MAQQLQQQLTEQMVPLLQQQLTAHIDASLQTTQAALQVLTEQHQQILTTVTALGARAEAHNARLQQGVAQVQNEVASHARLQELVPPEPRTSPEQGDPAPSVIALDPHHTDCRPTVSLGLKDLPVYSAEEKTQRVDRWLYQARRMFQVMHLPEEEWVLYATFRLDGAALAWWQTLEFGQDAPSEWCEFSRLLKEQFGSLNPEQNARDTFWYHLRQAGTVRDYIKEFRSVLLELPTVDEGTKRDRFIQGLRDVVRHEVVYREPQTLAEAMALAERYERASSRANTLGRPRTYAQAVVSTSRVSAPPVRRLPPRDVVMAEGSRPAKLTDEERERLRATGSCFRCRQPGHISSQCPVFGFKPRLPLPGRQPLALITTDETETVSESSNN